MQSLWQGSLHQFVASVLSTTLMLVCAVVLGSICCFHYGSVVCSEHSVLLKHTSAKKKNHCLWVLTQCALPLKNPPSSGVVITCRYALVLAVEPCSNLPWVCACIPYVSLCVIYYVLDMRVREVEALGVCTSLSSSSVVGMPFIHHPVHVSYQMTHMIP